MDVKRELFLPALKAALKNEKVLWEEKLEPQIWAELFQIAGKHQVLPMIYEATYDCPAARNISSRVLLPVRQKTIRAVMLQTMKTSEFLDLFQHLQQSAVDPMVVKGIVCRNLYPNPDYRMSGDEDILIPTEKFLQCHQAMLDYGMQLSSPPQDITSAYEASYVKPGGTVRIEIHKCLFPPESSAYGNLNRFFEGVRKRSIMLSVDGRQIITMGCTDHLFYLICHAFKHFLHSGFGIRQVCDVTLFANAYGREIDWLKILRQCREIHADVFAAVLFQIGQKYLTFDPEMACYPEEWRKIQADEDMMLDDILDAGIYGDGSMSRRHSSNITLNAVSAQKHGKHTRHSVLKTVFLSADSLKGRYPYLKKHPYLLPVAWISRIVKYYCETAKNHNNNAANAITIGNRRVEMLRQYKIID